MTDAPLSVNLSESALQILQEGPAPGETSTGIARIAIAGRRSGEFQYDFEQIISSDVRDDDVPVEFEGLKFYVEASSAASLEGATIDYVTDKLGRSGFTVDNPNPLFGEPFQIVDTLFRENAVVREFALQLLDDEVVRSLIAFVANRPHVGAGSEEFGPRLNQ